jgi:hypothetical protein
MTGIYLKSCVQQVTVTVPAAPFTYILVRGYVVKNQPSIDYGQSDSAAGIPALKECPDRNLTSLPTCFSNSILRVAISLVAVKNSPLSNVKTGKFSLTKLALLAFRPFKASNGQQSGNGKISTKSPRFERMDFGTGICITAWLSKIWMLS